jgi:hypothetical protein
MTVYSATDRDTIGPLSKIVLQWGDHMKRIVDYDGKQPGFGPDGWSDIAALANVEEFERVGSFLEVVRWNEYLELMTNWAITCEWDSTLKRITEVGRVVIQELEERNGFQGTKNVINSVSIFEFDENDKIRHLDIYMQMRPSVIESAKAGGWAKEEA